MGFHHVLDEKERAELLAIARETLEEHLKNGLIPPKRPENEVLAEGAGAFVTLKTTRGMLRGCIGSFSDQTPLYRTVQEMAISAALKDPRFPPVTAGELDDLVIEISVLSGLIPAKPEEVEVGKHGVFITRGFARGVLLPQVPVEQGWDRETFLEHVSLKAGLPPHAYTMDDAKLEVFTAQVFSERD
jgi:hypothetical protein